MTRMSVGDGINEALAENMYGKYSWFLRYNGGTLNIFSFSDGIDENAFKYPKPKTMTSNPPKLDNSKQDVMYAHQIRLSRGLCII